MQRRLPPPDRGGDAEQRCVAPVALNRVGKIKPQVVRANHGEGSPVLAAAGGNVLERRKRARRTRAAATAAGEYGDHEYREAGAGLSADTASA